MARKKKVDEIDTFKAWIASQGGEVLEPTNEWEVLRFRGNGETSIIYTNKKGQRTYTGQALEALEAFRENKPFRLCKATARKTYGREHPIDKTIRERDGDTCFFCGKEFTSSNPRTREHLVPTTAGGPNHITNMFHAHRACNARAGHLSAPEKIRIREANLYGAKQ